MPETATPSIDSVSSNDAAAADIAKSAVNTAPEADIGDAEVSDREQFAAEFKAIAQPSTDDEINKSPVMPWEKDEKSSTKSAGKTKDDALKGGLASTSAEEREKFVMAKRALARDGWSDERLKKLDTADILELGEKATKRQADTDKAFADLRGLKSGKAGKPAGSHLPGDTTGPNTTAGRSGDEDDVADDSETAQAADTDDDGLIGRLAEEYLIDPKDIKDLRAAMKPKGPTSNELTEARTRANQAATRLLATQIDRSVERLTERFPALKDTSRAPEVEAKILALDPTGELRFSGDQDKVEALFADACSIVFGEELRQQTRQSLIAGNKKTRNGQPESPGSPTSRGAPMTAREKGLAEVAAHMRFANDPDGLRKALASIDAAG